MTNDAQRIAMAELEGWKPEVRRMFAGVKNAKGWGRNAHRTIGHPDREFVMYPGSFPRYDEDLNAVRRVEEKLTGKQWDAYSKELQRLTREQGNEQMPQWREVNPSNVIDVLLIHASAAQKTEAILRAANRWTL